MNIWVNPNGNDNRNGQSETYQSGIEGPKRTIANAVISASPGDTIMLLGNTTYYEHNIFITKKLYFEIMGTGIGSCSKPRINAQGKGWIFNIEVGVTVNLKNLIFENGGRRSRWSPHG